MEGYFSDQFTFILRCSYILQMYFTVVKYSMRFDCKAFLLRGSAIYYHTIIVVRCTMPFRGLLMQKGWYLIEREGNCKYPRLVVVIQTVSKLLRRITPIIVNKTKARKVNTLYLYGFQTSPRKRESLPTLSRHEVAKREHKRSFSMCATEKR